MIDLEAAYRQHGPMVLRRCRRLLRDEAAAVDAMHDVFVALLRRKESLYDAPVSALVLRVATNVCLNRLRTTRRRPEDRDESLLLQIAAAMPDDEARGAARQLLERLFRAEPESTFTIAVLCYVDRMTLEETAAEVGLSVSGVRKRLRKLRARLGAAAEPEGAHA